MPFRPRVALTLLAALFILALPASASAATYTVNSTGDQEDASPGSGGCATNVPTCTLRAAIEESNASTGTPDEILFNSSFDGELDDSTITVGFSLPVIVDELTIDGDGADGCITDAGVFGPCVGVQGESRFEVSAAKVRIEGLAISDAQVAITVEDEEFAARGNWIGFELDGTDGPAEQSYGIFVGPNGDNAVIGGTTAAARNVLGNTNSALILRGSSFGTVLGNVFGDAPDGPVAPNGRNLVIANKLELGGEVAATNNQIGADVGEAGTLTPSCDFGCNVFASTSTATAAIDLQGVGTLEEEAPATGPTQIEGNFLGMNKNGAPFSEAATSGIRVGSADDVTIGGSEPGQGNRIYGGSYGVFAGSGGDPALDLVVEGNSIGRNWANDAVVFPPGNGISISSAGLLDAEDVAELAGNSISSTGGGIEAHGTGAVIVGNTITGSALGIHTFGSTDEAGIGNLIAGNEIVDPLDEGIYVENDFNQVLGNEISGAGAAGIAVRAFTTMFGSLGADDNLIGGDEPGDENTIVGSDGDAIEIRNLEGTFTEVARNLGSGNDTFISLSAVNPGTEPVGPNGGIVTPQISSAGKTATSGTAEPFALVRVFRKASAEKGELAAFLGEATADAGGNWSVSYAALPGKTLVTATQTKEGGTSELDDPVATPADPTPPNPDGVAVGCPDASGTCPPSPVVRAPRPPNTKIVKGPAGKTTKATVAFKFRSIGSSRGFECKLDKGKFKKCSSPKTYRNLKPGQHVFKVRAVGPTGVKDSTPAKRKFTVLG